MKKHFTLFSRKTVFLLVTFIVSIIAFGSCSKTSSIKPKSSNVSDTATTNYTNNIIGFWAIIPDSMAVQTANGIVPITNPTTASAVDSMFTAFAIDKTIQFQSGSLFAVSPDGVTPSKPEYFGWHTQGGSHTAIIITDSNIMIDEMTVVSVKGSGAGAELRLYVKFLQPTLVTDGNASYTGIGYYVSLVGLAY